MIFMETPVVGAFVVDLEPIEDRRGCFARAFCSREFAEHGLGLRVVQCNLSSNRKKGTVRGMHYQVAPHEEAKLVRCTRGSIYDVVLDLRRNSPTYGRWHAVELNRRNHRMLYVPRGCAHGFQTLKDDTEVFYQVSAFYSSESARCVRWDDPAFGIRWPLEAAVISDKDRDCPDFEQ